MPELTPKPCCGNCRRCDFRDYIDEDGEYQAYWDCMLEHDCFDFDDGFCDDYE